MVGVFCAVTNSPITSLLIAAELFGFNGMPFYCIVVAVSYLLSGYYSLYKEQKIVYSKTENKYVGKERVLVSKNNLVKQSDERDSCFWNLTGIRRHRLRALFEE